MVQHQELDKGKSLERVGGKATDLSPVIADMVAGLPGEYSKQLVLPLTYCISPMEVMP